MPIKVFYCTLNRTSVGILVIPVSTEIWWRKRDSKVNFSTYVTMMTTAADRLFIAWIHDYARIRIKIKVNSGRWIVCKLGWLVNNLTIARRRCNVPSNIVTRIKKYHLEHFLSKSAVRLLRLLMLFIRMSRESRRDWNCSRLWLEDLYEHLSKHRSFFTVISVTKHSFRLDISSLQIMRKCSL